MLVAQQPEQPPAASVTRRENKPVAKFFEPAVIKQPAAPEPDVKILTADDRNYPLHDQLFFDDGTAWRPTELSDEILLDSISIYEDRIKGSRIPSEKDKERLRAMEQELQRRTAPTR